MNDRLSPPVMVPVPRRVATTLWGCVLWGYVLWGCGEPAPVASKVAAAPNPTPGATVVLISIDTLRSDRLPVYGYDAISTPSIDALRRDAVLCQRAYSHVGLTFPSHASILTGLTPLGHGVRDNVGYRLASDVSTLPGALRDQGYRTGAFVSAYVLRRATGLDRGFEHYDDLVQVLSGRQLGSLQRSGEETLERALSWVESVVSEPFFLFFHIYEPHSPYQPSEPFASRYDDPYDGEVATADAIVGRLLGRLRELGVYERAIVVLLSDHGEGLMDHGEPEHEVLLYRETLQVPLLVKLPGNRRGGTTIETAVQLADVAPTIYRLLALSAPPSLAGRSIFELDRDEPREIFSESVYSRIHLGWSDLASIIRGGFHLIEGPDPELYDLTADPGETRNLRHERPRLFRELRRAMARYDRTLEAPFEVDDETREALLSLGYLSGSAARPEAGEPLADPKSRIHVLQQLGEAAELILAGRSPEAAEAYRRVLAEEPRMVFAWEQLGRALRSSQQTEAALEAYSRALQLSEEAPRIFLATADIYLEMGRLEEAKTHALSALRGYESAHDLLAQIALRQDDLEEAERRVEQALAHRGTRVTPLVTQTELLVRTEHYEEALAVSLEAEREFGQRSDREVLRGLYFQRGHALARLGRLSSAAEAYRQEIELSPGELAPYSFLAFLYALENRAEDAAAVFEQMLTANPTPLAHAEAVRTLNAMGDPESARRLLARALRRWPNEPALRELVP